MTRRCLKCKKEIDEFEYSVYCEKCREYSLSSNSIKDGGEYNYILNHNKKDAWDNQATYYYGYEDQYDW